MVAEQQAEEQEPPEPAPSFAHPWRAHPFALDAMVGVATPTGNLGVWADYAPLEYVSLSLGFGANLRGAQFAGMIRGRLIPERRNTPFIGAGYSQGPHLQDDDTQDGLLSVFLAPMSSMGEDRFQSRHWDTARWLNLEGGWDHRSDSGFDLRAFLGLAMLLNPSDNVVDPPESEYQSPVEVHSKMVYAGVALGLGQ